MPKFITVKINKPVILSLFFKPETTFELPHFSQYITSFRFSFNLLFLNCNLNILDCFLILLSAINGLNFNFSPHFGQLHSKPGSSHTSFGNSRQGDCLGFSLVFLFIFSMVAKTEAGGVKRCPHNGQSAEGSRYFCSLISHIRRTVIISVPGYNKFFPVLIITTSPESFPITMPFRQIFKVLIEESVQKLGLLTTFGRSGYN